MLNTKLKHIVGVLFFSTILLLTGCNGNSNGEDPIPEPDDIYVHTVGRFEDILFFPEPTSLISVEIDTLGRKLPESKNDGELNVITKLSIDGAHIKTYSTIKVQGSSTAFWPKKNWSLTFYEDKARKELLRVKLGDSVAPSKWILKAEWVDPSMLRNALSFRLWKDMVESRTGFPKYESDNAWSDSHNLTDGRHRGGLGFPFPYPAHTVMNGEHYGMSLFMMGHEPANHNIDKSNPNHVYMEFDARYGEIEEKTWEKFSVDGIDEWIEGYYPKTKDFNDDIKDSINNLSLLINGTQSNFNENVSTYLDKTNLIDYLLFIEMIYDYDAVAQDLEMVTYDLEKWYFQPWDKDTTFGMDWNEGGIRPYSATNLLIKYNTEDVTQKPWHKTYKAFTSDVEARYAALRSGNVFTVDNIYKLISDFTKHFPTELWDAEALRWAEDERPSLDETGPAQIIDWFGIRLDRLDRHFNYI